MAATVPSGSRSTMPDLPWVSRIQSPGMNSPKILRTSSRASPSRSRVASASERACSGVLPRSATITSTKADRLSARIPAARSQISSRSAAGTCRNRSRASRAAAMARVTSSVSAFCTWAITLPSMGEVTSNVAPAPDSCHSPSIRIRSVGTPLPSPVAVPAGPSRSGKLDGHRLVELGGRIEKSHGDTSVVPTLLPRIG